MLFAAFFVLFATMFPTLSEAVREGRMPLPDGYRDGYAGPTIGATLVLDHEWPTAERVAAIVNAEPGVNHNYAREHERFASGDRRVTVAVEGDQRVRPVECLGDAGRLEEIHGPQPLRDGDDLLRIRVFLAFALHAEIEFRSPKLIEKAVEEGTKRIR